MINTSQLAKLLSPYVTQSFGNSELNEPLKLSIEIGGFGKENVSKSGECVEHNIYKMLGTLSANGLSAQWHPNLYICLTYQATLATEKQAKGLVPASSWTQPELWSVEEKFYIQVIKWSKEYTDRYCRGTPDYYYDWANELNKSIERIQHENAEYNHTVKEPIVYISVVIMTPEELKQAL